MGVTLAGSSEGTPFYRNCNDIALQLQWPKGYVETSVAPTGVQIGARAQHFENKTGAFQPRIPFGSAVGYWVQAWLSSEASMRTVQLFFALFGVGIPC